MTYPPPANQPPAGGPGAGPHPTQGEPWPSQPHWEQPYQQQPYQPPQPYQPQPQQQPYQPQAHPPQAYPPQGYPPAQHQPPAQQAYPQGPQGWPQPPAPPQQFPPQASQQVPQQFPAPPSQSPPARRTGRVVGGVLLCGFGLLAALGGGGLVAHAVSNSRQEITDKTYMRDLWRNLPVETVFPASIGVHDPESESNAERGWSRVAVSQDTSCKTALSGSLAATAAQRGCIAAVRATYLDPTGGTAATAAVIAFSSEDGRKDLDAMITETQREKHGADQAVHALAAPGLSWKDAFRAGSGGGQVFAPYVSLLVVVTSGPADGRRAGRLPEPWGGRELQQEEDLQPWAETANGLAETLAARLGAEAVKVRA
ncbi:hypothetical protein AB0395_34605 [Streptosporangium sp. NPDC051023]|uniref:hypothetical protein n=1 Tax=Streptosporangium sp. NPDC051023 TaxID=3155410 RepID=UPI00344E08B0